MSGSVKEIGIKELCQEASALIESILNKKVESITGVTKEDEEWKVLAEVLERRAVPDTQDILNTYELNFTDELKFTGYKRVGMRHRGDMFTQDDLS